MPVLPLDHPEPFAATLGVMLYPGLDDEDRGKARAFASHYLAEPISQLHAAGHTLEPDALLRLVIDAGARLDDLDARWWQGTATGELFKTYFALANTDPALASWSHAIRIAERVAARQRMPGSRSGLEAARGRFCTVAHLWAAWCIRDGRFTAAPDAGYDLTDDFAAFLTEAEILRKWGQSWQPRRAKAEPPLPKEVWRVPDGWQPPPQQPGWPDTGHVPVLTVPEDLLSDLRPAGRPKTPR